MSIKRIVPVLEQTRACFRKIARDLNLLDSSVTVLAKPLTPEEAIGEPGRRDFPIVTGQERVIESMVLDAKGHAFTDSPREFMGTLEDVLAIDLDSNQNRAIYLSTLNALLSGLNMATGTVHCRDDEPEQCAREISRQLHQRYGNARIGLIGMNPAIVEELVGTFGVARVAISDLNDDNIGKRRFGVLVQDGGTQNEDLINAADVVLLTGTTMTNGTFDQLWSCIRARDKAGLVYGVTAAGAGSLLGFERICPYGRSGRDISSSTGG